MSSTDLPPLLRLPLHTIAHILSNVKTIQDLRPIILSHSIFRDALKDNFNSVASAIIMRQVAKEALPFLLALVGSQRLSLSDPAAAKQLLGLAASTCPVALPSLGLSRAEYAYMSSSCSSARTIYRQMASEVKPLHHSYLGPAPKDRQYANHWEKFRISRAVFRYQLMCNLFCHRLCLIRMQEFRPRFDDWDLKRLFFSSFSPWVNEELMCVFVYLRRKVAQAYDDITLHDVSLNHERIEAIPDVNFISQIHWMLCMGLPFLSRIASGGTLRSTGVPQFSTGRSATRAYNPHTILLCSKLVPGQLTLNPPLRDPALPMHAWEKSQILQLDPQRAPQNSPFRAWLGAHFKNSISRTVCCDADTNLWFLGYVLWTSPREAAPPLEEVYETCKRVRVAEPIFPRPGKEWGKDDHLRSRRQRKDIYRAGGEGFWPREGGDWSEIYGLTEAQKKTLEAKWLHEGLTESTRESSGTK
ncbi:unnamed protein product [Clonostachys byssicola]|uniref:Uncharacterized protein n=1 Tax=Clonostachys byssicola TaxID=160290 RepID=A0A9N9UPQ0_9HYPO|nr:unnamed protein product [Clonostachys byssicola]